MRRLQVKAWANCSEAPRGECGPVSTSCRVSGYDAEALHSHHQGTFVPSCRSLSSTVSLVALLALAAHRAAAQPWATTQQGASWYAAFVDHAVTDRTALWFDGQWRRMGVGAQPQQLLLRPGVQRTLAPGVRVATGYAFIATAPYGETPIADPLREHRIWQQLTLVHRAGPVSVSHRYRWEQRWLSSLVGANDVRTPSAYQQRARYMVRAQGDVPGLLFRGRPVLGFIWDELLMPVGHGNESVRLTQNRIGGGFGLPIDARQRVEIGYMNLWNALPAQRANEVNHTFTVSWVWTKAR
jgi:hypothetical protein